MNTGMDLTTLRDFGIALLIGALVGIDREKRKPEGGASDVPGVRTFMVLALLGAMAGWMTRQLHTPWILVGVIVSVAGIIVAGYLQQARSNPDALGLTTEFAGLAVCLVGAITLLDQPGLGVALGIAISALLTFKQPIHGVVRKLGMTDLQAGLKLLIATFVVLPVLPNRAVDPWGAIIPYQLWWLVILIASLSLVGYVATRWLGQERGLAITGLTGGLVSSTAVTLAFAKRSRESSASLPQSRALAVGILVAWVVMFIRILVEVAVVNPSIWVQVSIPCGCMGLATIGLAAGLHFQGARSADRAGSHVQPVPLQNPFSLRAAIKFALLFAVVLLVVKGAQHLAPGRGLYVVALLAGSTDVDAITLSMAAHAQKTGESSVAIRAITLAALSNTVVKAGLVVALGGPSLRAAILRATAIILFSGLASLFVV